MRRWSRVKEAETIIQRNTEAKYNCSSCARDISLRCPSWINASDWSHIWSMNKHFIRTGWNVPPLNMVDKNVAITDAEKISRTHCRAGQLKLVPPMWCGQLRQFRSACGQQYTEWEWISVRITTCKISLCISVYIPCKKKYAGNNRKNV
jgi:hypothetical protein